jgi:hypothetical protein
MGGLGLNRQTAGLAEGDRGQKTKRKAGQKRVFHERLP